MNPIPSCSIEIQSRLLFEFNWKIILFIESVFLKQAKQKLEKTSSNRCSFTFWIFWFWWNNSIDLDSHRLAVLFEFETVFECQYWKVKSPAVLFVLTRNCEWQIVRRRDKETSTRWRHQSRSVEADCHWHSAIFAMQILSHQQGGVIAWQGTTDSILPSCAALFSSSSDLLCLPASLIYANSFRFPSS